ncbi:hypothetical protein NQ318_020946 [Aromia moschata]|uniref:Protein root UVB sensitive/RUS domain-containing protein n=1 Tax=Aromia moschata TaxID=1265417 RepID=A0AAV8Y2E5_9CUCU|nr:hypothetical protein NQ318_020946 [Aromia moschata]
MPETDILIAEQCGSIGNLVTYARKGRNDIVQIRPRSSILQSFQFIVNFLRELLLPHGYPDSVSEDYLEYQLWDTAQAFCSTITGAFTTRAILKGVGVGNAEATALSAAITWILKEGTGMISRIIFAWWKGSEWILIVILMILHLFTNFLAVKSLVFKTFNNQRMALLLKTYFNVGTVLNPQKVNIKESVLLGSGLQGWNLDSHSLPVGEWRIDWKSYSKKNL